MIYTTSDATTREVSAAHWIPHDEYHGRVSRDPERYTANPAIEALSIYMLGRRESTEL